MVIMTEPGTDRRLDDLRSETHRGFERIDGDIRELRADLRNVRSETKGGFEKVDGDIRDLRTEMTGGFAKVDGDIAGMRAEIGSLQRLMIGFFATTLGSLIAGVIVIVASHS